MTTTDDALTGRREASGRHGRFAHPRSAGARWPTAPPVVAARQLLQWPLFGSLGYVAPAEVVGPEGLDTLTPPVLFAANHTSHFDTPVVLRALPEAWRRRTAVAAAKDYFFTQPVVGGATALLFNAFPFARGQRVRPALGHCAWLTSQGWSILLFPEGTRSTTGDIGAFRPGIGVLAVELQLPVVPIRTTGLFEVLPKGRSWPRRGAVSVRFGAPLRFSRGVSYEDAARDVELAVRGLET